MRYFKFVGDPDNYSVYQEEKDDKNDYKFFNQFIFKPEKGETYKGSHPFYWKDLEVLTGTCNYQLINLDKFIDDRSSWYKNGFDADSDWVDVTDKLIDEEAFINQCAIAAMKEFISSPERFPEALDLVNIPILAFNVAEEMNKERKKRIKKSSS